MTKTVVICLKNRTFAVLQTTSLFDSLAETSCDLLEKSYFCCIANNARLLRCSSINVVICLKNRTFAVLQTTQPNGEEPLTCCDLLEKSYFCCIANN